MKQSMPAARRSEALKTKKKGVGKSGKAQRESSATRIHLIHTGESCKTKHTPVQGERSLRPCLPVAAAPIAASAAASSPFTTRGREEGREGAVSHCMEPAVHTDSRTFFQTHAATAVNSRTEPNGAMITGPVSRQEFVSVSVGVTEHVCMCLVYTCGVCV